ncbi:MAG: hypothetical protein PVJ36_00155 [Nitrospirota bacterium]
MKTDLRFAGGGHPLHARINSHGLTRDYVAEKPLSREDARSFAREVVSRISALCTEQEALDIGHIKDCLEFEGGFIFADTVGSPDEAFVEARGEASGRKFRLTVNAVIVGLAEEQVKNSVEKALSEKASEFGLAVSEA